MTPQPTEKYRGIGISIGIEATSMEWVVNVAFELIDIDPINRPPADFEKVFSKLDTGLLNACDAMSDAAKAAIDDWYERGNS